MDCSNNNQKMNFLLVMLGCLVCFASCQPPNRNRTVNTHDDSQTTGQTPTQQTTEHPTKEATTHDSANLTNQTLINKSGDSNADQKNISDDDENTETTAKASDDLTYSTDAQNDRTIKDSTTTAISISQDENNKTDKTTEASKDPEDHSDHHNNHEVASTEKAVDHTNCPDHSEHQINHNHHIRRHMDAKNDVEVTTARNASGETSSDELLDDNATVVLIYDVYYPESSEKDHEANYVSSSEECDNCNEETGLSSIECYNCNLW